MIVPIKVQGIPCLVRSISYTPADPGRITGPVDLCYPPEPAEIEFHVLDRRGKRAEWLESKMTDEDRRAIEEKIISEFDTRAAEDRAELAYQEWGAYA